MKYRHINNKAFSMIELLVAIVLFALMLTPMLFVSSNQNRNAQSVGKHLMATQICASIMDSLMSCPYKEVIDKNEYSEQELKNNEMFSKIFNSITDEAIKTKLEGQFENFKVSFNRKDYPNDKMASITVTVSYRVFEGMEDSRRSTSLHALKYGYKLGD